MDELTWDDVLDDFEDLVDDFHDCLDAGRIPVTTAGNPAVPESPMEPRHELRFGSLQRAANDAAERLGEAMKLNEAARSRDRERVLARREYGAAGRSRR